MITFNGKKGQFHIVEKGDNTGAVTFNSGDEIIIPKNPIWISEGDGTNPNYRLRVMAVKKMGDNMIVAPIYKSAFAAKDRETNEWVIDNELSSAIRVSHGLFSDQTEGRVVKVVTPVKYQAYAFTPAGDREFNEDGTPKLRVATTYEWELGDAVSDEDLAKAADLVKDFCKKNYDVDTNRYKN